MAKCCGGSAPQTDYEVTLPDGTVKVVASMAEVRFLKSQYATPGGKALTFKPVKRKA